jgi:hypothetical protein
MCEFFPLLRSKITALSAKKSAIKGPPWVKIPPKIHQKVFFSTSHINTVTNASPDLIDTVNPMPKDDMTVRKKDIIVHRDKVI